MLAKAIAIAAQAHLNQKDRAGAPYILHPLRMMFQLRSEMEMIVAVLHDVIEDCPDWDFDRLHREGFSEEIIEALEHVTRREEESYETFVERSAQNDLARRVKLADLEDNMDIKRLNTLTEQDQARLARYHRAWQRLNS